MKFEYVENSKGADWVGVETGEDDDWGVVDTHFLSDFDEELQNVWQGDQHLAVIFG